MTFGELKKIAQNLELSDDTQLMLEYSGIQ